MAPHAQKWEYVWDLEKSSIFASHATGVNLGCKWQRNLKTGVDDAGDSFPHILRFLPGSVHWREIWARFWVVRNVSRGGGGLEMADWIFS